MNTSSSSENARTIASYEQGADLYATATGTISAPLKAWIDAAVDRVPLNARIFEVGSGTGRDALYLQSLGYGIECSDATRAFLLQLRAHGLRAHDFNILTDEFTDQYDLIFADAVLLHITREQIPSVFQKVVEALVENGRFALTLKEGGGEEWVETKIGQPRYFCYWDEPAVRNQLRKAGFREVAITRSGPMNNRWLNIIASI